MLRLSEEDMEILAIAGDVGVGAALARIVDQRRATRNVAAPDVAVLVIMLVIAVLARV
jgi:hypothetical protein